MKGRETPALEWRPGEWKVGLLAAVAMTIAAAGCGDADHRALSGLPAFCQEVLPRVQEHLEAFPQPDGERYGGTVVAGGLGELTGGMNSLTSPEYMARLHQEFVNLSPLIRVDSQLEYQPHLARDWEFSEDGTRLTFHLRDDVYWHDGEPTTAYDVEFTYLRATDPETGFFSAGSWEPYTSGPDGVEVVDDHTIRFTLEPHPEPLDIWRVLAVLPRHLLEAVPVAELGSHPWSTQCPVGNGPFVFESRDPGASWTFIRNPAHPPGLGGAPYLDRYIYRIIPEQSTLLTELLTGSIHLYLAPNPDAVGQIQSVEEVELLDFPFREYVAVAWNSRRSQLEDPRVRRALTVGTNREEMIQASLSGYGEIANAGVPPFHWAYHDALSDVLAYDPDEAARLLEEAGWRDRNGDGFRENAEGERLTVSVAFNMGNRLRQEVAEIMQAQLGSLGVELQPRAVEWGAFVQEMTSPESRDFDGAVLSIVTSIHISDFDQFHSSANQGPMALSGMADPELDRLLDSIQVVVDREEATPLWHRYQERIVELQPYTYLFFPRRLAGIDGRLEGVEMDARGELATLNRWWFR
jgi:peptide/nickel transport system substrate-binding protein